MAKNVGELIENLKSVLAKLEQMPTDLKVVDFALDMGGYTEPSEISSISLSVEQVKEDDFTCLSVVVDATQVHH